MCLDKMINLLGGGAGPWGCMPSRTHSSFASVSSDERSVVGHSEDDPAIFYLHLPTYDNTHWHGGASHGASCDGHS